MSTISSVPLSPREQQVLELLTFGLREPQIAARLGVSRSAVHNVIASLRGKLGGARCRTEAVVRAFELGLVK